MRVLSRLFRRLRLKAVSAAHAAGPLSFFDDDTDLADAQSFAAYLAPLRKAECMVYAKRPSSGPQAVLAVNMRPRLTPPLLGRSIAWLADRPRDPRRSTPGAQDIQRNHFSGLTKSA